jgi:hypothetical protein
MSHPDDKAMAEEGVVAAGREESLVPYNLTLQWLESNTTSWPSHTAGLLKIIRGFCNVEVDIGPEAIVMALDDLGAVTLSGPGPAPSAKGSDKESKAVTDKQRVEVQWDNFGRVREQLERGKVAAATAAVLQRVLPLLEAYRGDEQRLPRTRGALEELAAPHGHVAFRANPRGVLDELEANEFVQCSANSDEVIYDGDRIVTWRSPPLNKGFGVGTLLLVVVIVIMLVPGLARVLGLF